MVYSDLMKNKTKQNKTKNKHTTNTVRDDLNWNRFLAISIDQTM